MRCTDILKSLGYDELPANTVSGLDANGRILYELWTSRHDATWLQDQTYPAYQYWKRWTDGEVMVEDFHAAYLPTVEAPIIECTQDLTTIVDTEGNLLALKVILPEQPQKPNSSVEPQWDVVLDLAGIDREKVSEIAAVKAPKVYCDQLQAWTVDQGTAKERKIQAGTLAGRINYFEIVGLRDAILYSTNQEMPPAMMVLFVLVHLLVLAGAWYNVYSSRSDLRRAMAFALFVGMLYLFQEISALNIRSPGFVHSLFGLVEGRAFGHMLIHAAFVGASYLAIEPFVRRFWPRSLVGITRLFDGRFRDPVVGKELLVGSAIGCSFGLLGAFAFKMIGMMGLMSDRLVYGGVPALISSSTWISGQINFVSGCMLACFMIASICVLIRFFSSNPMFPKHLVAVFAFLLICIAVPKLVQSYGVTAGLDPQQDVAVDQEVGSVVEATSDLDKGFVWYLPFIMMAGMLALSNVFFRIGLLATFVTMVTLYTVILAPPLHVSSWYSGPAMASMASLILLSGFGFLTSQGGVAALVKRLEITEMTR